MLVREPDLIRERGQRACVDLDVMALVASDVDDREAIGEEGDDMLTIARVLDPHSQR